MKFPDVKKKVNSYLLCEEGKISKSSIIRAGVILASVASISMEVGSAGDSVSEGCDPCYAHNNDFVSKQEDGKLITQHEHHYNHT
ncbi:MAG: hypothetical protein ACOCQG_06025, partial [Candidatus Nanoarchaeia archaeon]